jgi:hypothetical protein
MSRARNQEWLRVHLETLYPDRQAARERARRERAPRRRNVRPRPWAGEIKLELQDVWAGRVRV